jgi:hypothetical protein
VTRNTPPLYSIFQDCRSLSLTFLNPEPPRSKHSLEFKNTSNHESCLSRHNSASSNIPTTAISFEHHNHARPSPRTISKYDRREFHRVRTLPDPARQEANKQQNSSHRTNRRPRESRRHCQKLSPLAFELADPEQDLPVQQPGCDTTTFICFPNLPIEVRLMIWRATFLKGRQARLEMQWDTGDT